MCDRSRGNLSKLTKEVIFTKNIDWNKSAVKFRSLRSFLDRVNVKKFNFLRIFKFMLSSAEIWGQRCTFFGYSRKSTIRDLKIFDHIKQIWKHLCTFIWYFCPPPPLPPVGFPPPLEQIHRTNKIASQN